MAAKAMVFYKGKEADYFVRNFDTAEKAATWIAEFSTDRKKYYILTC